MRRKLFLSALMILTFVLGVVAPVAGQEGEVKQVTLMHYFSGELGNKAIAEIITNFTAEHKDFVILSNPIGHEDFKTTILIMLAGDEPPDFFSYWAGARVQFVVDAGRLAPIDDLWTSAALDDIIPASLVSGATIYNGQHYLIPFNYHFAGFFYNPQVFADAGITTLPTTWDEFLACAKPGRLPPHRSWLDEPLARAVLVRLSAAAHRWAGIPRQADGRGSRIHRSRSCARDGNVERTGR
jgi:multiple sugar transport system substrate-binding protein/raffinose/stachyose/melibiose transport system substrate-binding protein